MKQSVLPLMACPAPARGGACGGPLSAGGRSGPDPVTVPGDPDELREGALLCGACGTEFPVLSGVAILVPDPGLYVRTYRGALLRDLDRHGTLSPGARAWLSRRGKPPGGEEDYGADFRFSQQFEDPWTIARAMADPPADLYGPFAGWLEQASGHGPYDVLAGWARELAREPHLLLDAGCGGGGLVGRLAGRFGASFGVDLSFLAILLARRVLLHQPEPEGSYLLSLRCGEEVERPLVFPRAERAEFVVGDCRALPFPPGLFDAVCSSNVIDIAGLEPSLDEAERVLRPGGVFLLSDPFYFREGEAPKGEPRAAVRAALEARALGVEREQDGVPWAWATYDRHWRLYFNYCSAARKPG